MSIPDSRLSNAAKELARSALDVEMYNHSLRSFVLAELIGAARGQQHDRELLYVATMLHDIGTAPKYRSAQERFEVDGANVARAFLRANGVGKADQELVWDAIALHSSGSIARWKKPEVALSNAGIVTDVHGVYLPGLDSSAIRELLVVAPRTNFPSAFLKILTDVAREKPESTANTFVADVGHRMVPGFRLRNFVDDMCGEDPFAAYFCDGASRTADAQDADA